MMMKKAWLLCLIIGLADGASGALQDWHQFLGPNRNGSTADHGFVEGWLAAGLNERWRVPIGEGYSGLAVAEGKVFSMDSQGGAEFVLAMDAATGKTIWRVRSGSSPHDVYGGLGPRMTPTFDAETLFTVSARGTLLALRSDNGAILWNRDLAADLGWRPPAEGAASSPLIHNGLIYMMIGGINGRAFGAFDRENGKTVWAAQDDRPSYSSPIFCKLHGRDQILFLSGSYLFSVDAASGKLMWKYSWPTYDFVNVATPLVIPPDRVFISSGYDQGAALLRPRLNNDGSWSIQEIWRNREMKNHFNNSVYHDGAIFGFDNAVLKSVDAETGHTLWRVNGFGKGSVILVGAYLVILSETGELMLAPARKEEFRVEKKMQILSGRSWTPPSIAEKAMFLRNQREAVRLDVASK